MQGDPIVKKITWDDGASALVIGKRMNGRYDWGYCGGGPFWRDVRGEHAVAAVESLLGWNHPAAAEVRGYVAALGDR